MRKISYIIISFCIGLMLVYYIAAAEVHMDDLAFLGFPASPKFKSFIEISISCLMNKYVGVVETRTYGLSLLIQYLVLPIYRHNPIFIHLFIAFTHVMSGAILYWAMSSIEKDDKLRFLLAVAWVASPFVLPTSRTLHHFLYIMGPYYALVLWLGLVLNLKHLNVIWGALSLSCVWLLGEAAIPVAGAAVTAVAISLSRQGRKKDALAILIQAAISVSLLIAYLSYQRLCVFENSYRIHPVPPDSWRTGIERFGYILFGLYQSLCAFLGLKHIDPVLGRQFSVASLHYIGSPMVVISALVSGVACLKLSQLSNTKVYSEKRYLLATIALIIAASTMLLYLLFYVANGSLPFTPRYAPPVFTVAMIAIPIAFRAVAPKFGRIIIVGVTVVSLSLSLGLSEKYFEVVFKPMTEKTAKLASARNRGSDVLLITHIIPSASGVADVGGLWPGIGGAYDHFAPDPYKAFWTTRLYALAMLDYSLVAFDFREVDSNHIAVRYNDVWRTCSKDKIVVAGTVSGSWPHRRMPWVIHENFLAYEAAK